MDTTSVEVDATGSENRVEGVQVDATGSENGVEGVEVDATGSESRVEGVQAAGSARNSVHTSMQKSQQEWHRSIGDLLDMADDLRSTAGHHVGSNAQETDHALLTQNSGFLHLAEVYTNKTAQSKFGGTGAQTEIDKDCENENYFDGGVPENFECGKCSTKSGWASRPSEKYKRVAANCRKVEACRFVTNFGAGGTCQEIHTCSSCGTCSTSRTNAEAVAYWKESCEDAACEWKPGKGFGGKCKELACDKLQAKFDILTGKLDRKVAQTQDAGEDANEATRRLQVSEVRLVLKIVKLKQKASKKQCKIEAKDWIKSFARNRLGADPDALQLSVKEYMEGEGKGATNRERFNKLKEIFMPPDLIRKYSKRGRERQNANAFNTTEQDTSANEGTLDIKMARVLDITANDQRALDEKGGGVQVAGSAMIQQGGILSSIEDFFAALFWGFLFLFWFSLCSPFFVWEIFSFVVSFIVCMAYSIVYTLGWWFGWLLRLHDGENDYSFGGCLEAFLGNEFGEISTFNRFGSSWVWCMGAFQE